MNATNEFPSVSIIIPTLNAERTLEGCLRSIASQNYPRENLEIIIADGGSTDETLRIAENFITENTSISVEVIKNKRKTCEAGKSIGVKYADNEIIALIDSDNILEGQNWLKRMVSPFEDSDIVASEPLYYSYRKKDKLLNRYFALLGMNDPICLYLGNYDRYCHLTGKWTELKIASKDMGEYIALELDEENIPTIGANGFLVKKKYLIETDYEPYLFDLDIVYQIIKNGHKKFAKVKVGIVHLFANRIKTFKKKQKRRIMDYLFYKKSNLRVYPWKKINKKGLFKFVIYTCAVFPLLIEMLRGYRNVKDKAWLFHPLACWITLWIYATCVVSGRVKAKMFDRSKW